MSWLMRNRTSKLAFFLMDGLNEDAAVRNLGYVEHLVETKQASKIKVLGELPSLSRPMYETIFTGLPVYQHGITNNSIQRPSNCTSVFDLCRAAGLKSLALAYHWISELYVHSPFDPWRDVYLDDESKKISHGFFYYEDQFPDSHLYSLAVALIEKYESDFVFLHPMNIDLAGHLYGCHSKQYHQAVNKHDEWLSTIIPYLQTKGYSIIVASDHGMNAWGLHGGNEAIQRNSSLYLMDNHLECKEETITTRHFAPLMCKLLGIDPTKDMEKIEVKFREKTL